MEGRSKRAAYLMLGRPCILTWTFTFYFGDGGVKGYEGHEEPFVRY
jgi:hypothetical protein